MADALPDRRRLRRVGILGVVGLLVVFSGCSALGGKLTGGQTTDATTEMTETTETAEEMQATATTDESESTATTESEPTTTTAGDGHGHSHSHGGETTASESEAGDAEGSDSGTNDSGTSDSETDDSPRSGEMTVVVAGTELPLDQLASGAVSMAADDEHTWQASSNLTLAEALSSFGVDATAKRLTYDGTTYREAANGTSLNYRVNGESVDPESYTLRDGDQVWVTVETADANYSIPGEYIRANQQHIHGPATFVVEGEEIDFSEERFQSGHRHFHFEGGHANPWHAHSWSITLEYAFDTLPGIDISENAVTYNGTTYRDTDSGTNVSITVNGEAVDPTEYFLKDGDNVHIIVEREGS